MKRQGKKKKRNPTSQKHPGLCVRQVIAKEKQFNAELQLREHQSAGMLGMSPLQVLLGFSFSFCVFILWISSIFLTMFQQLSGHLRRWSIIWPKLGASSLPASRRCSGRAASCFGTASGLKSLRSCSELTVVFITLQTMASLPPFPGIPLGSRILDWRLEVISKTAQRSQRSERSGGIIPLLHEHLNSKLSSLRTSASLAPTLLSG